MPIQILQYGVKVRDPVTKQFNDLAALKGEPGGGTADALPLAGGTMSGNINMDSNKVTNLPTPTANGDAVPKSYTDSIVAISDTQPTATENKLWVDTDAGTGATYQVPTVAEMEAADAQVAANAMPKGSMVDITDQCQIGTGTIGYVRYYQTDRIIVLAVQVFNINFTGVNVWLQLPDSFPGNANVFTALATGFDGMECVFRTQSGSGKYLLIQSTQQGSYNLTGTGICFT